MITIYGIKNCDTMKKARTWLEAEGIAHRFHDFRADGLDRKTVAGWLKSVDRDVLINRRCTTWRKLPDDKKAVDSDVDAIALMLENPALIKRPVFDLGGRFLVGFTDDVRAALKAA